MPLPRITIKRQFVQGLLIAAALLLPFATISGNPFLRMDIAKMTLFLAGIPLRIDQFYLVLLVILLAVASFLLITAVLGRVWCGWLCPQTVFNDVVELLSGKTLLRKVQSLARPIEHGVALIISLLIAFNLFCWFMPPSQVASHLLGIHAHPVMFVTFLLLTLFGYINLTLIKRSFCRSYCPYGRFQTALMDAGTLNLSFLEETRDRCLHCNACVRTCPMAIDIREGFQVECIGCGRCIDACRGVMEKRSEGIGLIDYRFGTVKGTGFRLGKTTAALLLVALLLAAGLVRGVVGREQHAFAVQRVATAESRILPDGSQAFAWRAIIGNRSETDQVYSIRIDGAPPHGVELLGQTGDIRVGANQHREVIFMLHVTTKYRSPEKIVLQLLRGDRPAGSVSLSP
ncbi:MAG: 4Fe-4S dicluster domain-containing protein [Desulfuromonadaceae bacterium]